MNSKPIYITWKSFDTEEIESAIEELIACHKGLVEWTDRATHEWILSNYGRAPAHPGVKDEEVAHHLIQMAVYHHLHIEPNRYEFTVDRIGDDAPAPMPHNLPLFVETTDDRGDLQ